jgi:hypothetical protein
MVPMELPMGQSKLSPRTIRNWTYRWNGQTVRLFFCEDVGSVSLNPFFPAFAMKLVSSVVWVGMKWQESKVCM